MDAPLRTFSFTETKDIVQAIIQMAADKCKERYSNNADEILINAEKDILKKIDQFEASTSLPTAQNSVVTKDFEEKKEYRYSSPLPSFLIKPRGAEFRSFPAWLSGNFDQEEQNLDLVGLPKILEDFKSVKEYELKIDLTFDFADLPDLKKLIQQHPSLFNPQERNLHKTFQIQLKLPVAQHPLNLWKNIPANPEKYPKEDFDFDITSPNNDFICIAASMRGRSHAAQGTCRDDHFLINKEDVSGWQIITVADGAGSAKYSREGSKLACESFSKFMTEKLRILHATIPEGLEEKVSQLEKKELSEDPSFQEFGTCLRAQVIEAVNYAYKEIEKEANKEHASISDYATTLLAALIKKIGNKYFIVSYWVGDGALALYTKGKLVKLLGKPDEGKFSGETYFLTSLNKSMDYNRVRFGLSGDLTAVILMTDGISDPKFSSEENLNNYQKWDDFWESLPSIPENFVEKEEDLKQVYQKWLNFYEEGEHDDRTIAICMVREDKNV